MGEIASIGVGAWNGGKQRIEPNCAAICFRNRRGELRAIPSKKIRRAFPANFVGRGVCGRGDEGDEDMAGSVLADMEVGRRMGSADLERRDCRAGRGSYRDVSGFVYRVVAGSEGDLREVDFVLVAEAADPVGEVSPGGVFDLAAGRGEMDCAAAGGLGVGELQDPFLDRRSAGVGAGRNQIERAGAVEGELPAPALAPSPPDPV